MEQGSHPVGGGERARNQVRSDGYLVPPAVSCGVQVTGGDLVADLCEAYRLTRDLQVGGAARMIGADLVLDRHCGGRR